MRALTAIPDCDRTVQALSSYIVLVITHKSARPREAGVLDDCAPQILRCAQDDSLLHVVILSAAKDLWRTYR